MINAAGGFPSGIGMAGAAAVCGGKVIGRFTRR